MSAPCSDTFRTLAHELGGIACETARPFVTFRSPAGLRNGTLPIVELLWIGGAMLALLHALRVRKTTGRSANLALFCAAIVFVFALEPPLYFPEQIGAAEHLKIIFVHNVFSVQLLYDRLPLYIVSLYPTAIYLAYSLVARLGVFERRGRLVGAIAVGFVHQCFYEIFDHIGPQLRWWTWNPEAPQNVPALGSVPLTSMVIFAIVAPTMLAYAWRLLVAEPEERGKLHGARLAGRTILTGLATPVLMVLVAMPVSSLMLVEHPNEPLISTLLYGAIVVTGVITVRAFAGGASMPSADRFVDRAPLAYAIAYLATFAALWAYAMPALLAARGGVTADGAPIGNPIYAAACTAICVWIVWRAARATEGGVAERSGVFASVQ